MITKQQVYDATNNGLDVIREFFPNIKKGDKVKVRQEDDASCSLWQNDKDIWNLKDFGDRFYTIFDLVMLLAPDVTTFKEAILWCGDKFHIEDSTITTKNLPTITKRQASASEPDGYFSYIAKEQFTPADLAAISPGVKQEHCDALHLHSLVSFTITRRDKKTQQLVTITKGCTDTYPIFIRKLNGVEKDVYKIMEPRNADKKFRFLYAPAGKKPMGYVNGLYELKEAYEQSAAHQKEEWDKKEHQEGEVFKPRKLHHAVIVCGERDALVCLAMGHHPIWFNSETTDMPQEVHDEIMTYVQTLYFVPDIDDTGRREGRKLALRFPEVLTAWLPDRIRKFRDARGNPRKDLRDFMEMSTNPEKDFARLLKGALPAKFWHHGIDTQKLFYFLTLNGFYTMVEQDSEELIWVKVDGYKVTKVSPREIRHFTKCWVEEHVGGDIVNLVIDSKKFAPATLEVLDPTILNFKTYTHDSQMYFFPNVYLKVTADAITPIKQQEYNDSYVLAKNIIPHDFNLLDDFFTIKKVDGEYHLSINKVGSKLMAYLMNTSRIFWCKEMEERFQTQEERDAYRKDNLFRLDGEGLSEQEIAEQFQNMLNKIFAIGYLLHRHKSPSRAWGVMAYDWKIDEEGRCNGRSGKSLLFQFLKKLVRTATYDGRRLRIMDNNHMYDQVRTDTHLVLFDDCDKSFRLNMFFEAITGDLAMNPKFKEGFTIPFERSPKFVFTTNYVSPDTDASTEARVLPVVFGDYYHERTDGSDYLESRKVFDDFGCNLFDEQYNDADWNADLNFALQCLRSYLAIEKDTSVKLMPPMGNIRTRRQLANIEGNFLEWADEYFATDGGHLDCYLPVDEVLNECQIGTNLRGLGPKTFKSKLTSYCEYASHIAELNPKELITDVAKNRIRHYDQAEGRYVTCFYVRSLPKENDKSEIPEIF